MYFRMIRARVLPWKAEQATRIIERSIVPAVREQQGVVDVMAMENPDRNEFVILSSWETKMAMLAPERSGFVEQQMWKLSTVLSELATAVDYSHLDSPEASDSVSRPLLRTDRVS